MVFIYSAKIHKKMYMDFFYFLQANHGAARTDEERHAKNIIQYTSRCIPMSTTKSARVFGHVITGQPYYDAVVWERDTVPNSRYSEQVEITHFVSFFEYLFEV